MMLEVFRLVDESDQLVRDTCSEEEALAFTKTDWLVLSGWTCLSRSINDTLTAVLVIARHVTLLTPSEPESASIGADVTVGDTDEGNSDLWRAGVKTPQRRAFDRAIRRPASGDGAIDTVAHE